MSDTPEKAQREFIASGASRARATTAQEYFWSMGLDDPDPTAYHTTRCVLIEGALDTEALHRSMRTLIEAHAVFRTAIREIEGEAWQIVLPPDEVPRFELELVARSNTPQAEWRAEIQNIVRDLLTRGFDLDQGRVVRANVVELAPQSHALIVVVHHIAADQGSCRHFFARLFELYTAAVQGEQVVESPALQYIDIADAEAKWALTVPGKAQSAYWQRRLQDAPPMQVPLDLPRETADERRAAARRGIVADPMHPRETVKLAHDVREAITLVARKNRVTIYGVYVAGLLWLLHKETGQTDLCVETTLDLRTTDPRLTQVLGAVATWRILRVDLAGCEEFRDALPRVGQAIVEAKEHGSIPDYYRTVPHTLRRVVVNYVQTRWWAKETKTKEQAHHGLTLTRFQGLAPAWKRPWDLHLTINDGDDAVLIWTGNQRLFRRETIQALFQKYLGVLEAAVR